LILLYPLAIKFLHASEINLSFSGTIAYSLLAFFLAFSGSFIPIFLFSIVITLLGYWLFTKSSNDIVIKSMLSNNRYKIFMSIFLIFCLYSFFLGFYNSERNVLDYTLYERYKRVPIGLVNIWFGKPGLWILTILIFLNTFALKRSGSEKFIPFYKTLKWSALFILVYILLLPADGYYEFRPNIIRRDNFIPCILILVFLFSQSAVFLVEKYQNDRSLKRIIAVYLFSVILIFTIADSPSLRIDNCQRASLEMLSISDEKTVQLSDQCTIASWYIINDARDSEVNSLVFNYWNITKEPKLYFQN
jgi:hypothetical protein